MKMNIFQWNTSFVFAMDIDDTTKQFVGNKEEVVKEIITKVRGKSCDFTKSRSKL